jgi:cellulose synthase/poly-beta-1,6-N-acetylglucosamine synthase-like glycosyltransferase
MLAEVLTVASWALLGVCAVPAGYMFLLALASMWPRPQLPRVSPPRTRFIIAIPAHDEETVIARTVQRLLQLDYPRDLFRVHIVADHCSDRTAEFGRTAGAVVHERREEPRSGKGAALAWLFQRILSEACDAVVVFDSDTLVDAQFLRVMDAHIARGTKVVQGQHIISNPEEGWFPALTWSMFLVDNRYQNLGRSNLGFSAKHMGDSICFHVSVLRSYGWGEGLTEDYQLRQQLLLGGIRITYEPEAKGYGEATQTWQQARVQRARWLRGVYDASRDLGGQMLRHGVRRGDLAVLDGALQAYLPSFSTLSLIVLAAFGVQAVANVFAGPLFDTRLLAAWAALAIALFFYPLIGLALERAPIRAYLAMVLGPFFMIWRSWLAAQARFNRGPVKWVRTTHGKRGVP